MTEGNAILVFMVELMESKKGLLILAEIILGTKLCLLIVGQRGEVRLPTRTVIDVPTPETTQQRVGFCIIMGAEFTVFAIVSHNN